MTQLPGLIRAALLVSMVGAVVGAVIVVVSFLEGVDTREGEMLSHVGGGLVIPFTALVLVLNSNADLSPHQGQV